MKLSKASRVSNDLRKELVPLVKAALPAGADFNVLYGRLLSRMETAENPSVQAAQALLEKPQELLDEHATLQAQRQKARLDMNRMIIEANIPKKMENRPQVVKDTIAFLEQFPNATPKQVKELTELRQKNGNRDPQLVGFEKVATADELVEAMDSHYHVDGKLVLLEGESLKAAAPAPAMEM